MRTPSRRQTALAVAVCAAALFYVFPHYPALNNPNENVRVYMTAAIVEEGRYEIDGMRARWGWVNDAACVERGGDAPASPCVTPRAAPGRSRHYYSVKAPGTSLLGVPFYAAYRAYAGDSFDREEALWALRAGATILPLLLFFAFFHRFLHQTIERAPLADLGFYSVTLGSVLLGYGYLFASHATSAAAAFSAFGLLELARRRGGASLRASFVAGVCAAGASFFEYPAFIASALLCLFALWALRPRRRLLPFALGAALPTLAMMHFQWRAFDNPLSPGHLFVENAAFRALHEQGLFGSSGFHADAALRLLVDLRLGLLTTSPLFVLAPAGLLLLVWRRPSRAGGVVAAAICLLTYLMICTMVMWDGGWAIGPRYLVLTLPFLGWASVVALDRGARRWPRSMLALGLGCLGGGLLVSGLLSMYYPHLPPEISRPLSQLFPTLLAQDFAPHNAANLLGLYGTLSMLPMAVLGAGVWLAIARRGRLGWAAGVGALLLSGALVFPRARLPVPAHDPSLRMRTFICEHWSPAGHDRPTRLRDRLLAEGPAGSAEEWRQLADAYEATGRADLARAARRASEAAAARGQ